MKKVLLYSGGMDSWLIDKLWQPDVKLFFRINTPNNEMEYERVKNRSDVKIIEMDLHKFEQPDNNYFLPLRNLHFVTYAAHYGDIICLGATGSSTHNDKNEVFTTLSENAINYLLSEDNTREEPVKIVLPFKDTTKTELLHKYISLGGDINKAYEETFSCYSPMNGKPCMHCTSCISKFTAFYNNGYRFDDSVINEFINTVASGDIPCKHDAVMLARRLRHSNKTICVDFDNTITTKSQFPVTGNLQPDCYALIKRLHFKGYTLIMYTSRTGVDFDSAKQFCKDNELPFDDYVSGKPLADLYIDDKGYRFTDWNSIDFEELLS